MINKVLLTAYILLISVSALFSQETSLKSIKENFNNFEYGRVIELTDSLLNSKDSLPGSEISELLRMKAVSQYSLADSTGAAKSFNKILQQQPEFSLDSLNNSPKIVYFFNHIKERFKLQAETTRKETNENLKLQIPVKSNSLYLAEYNDKLRNTLVRSIILPGWGHFYAGNTVKGWLLGSLSMASAASFVYFISDSRTKEKEYLNEKDPALIAARYDKYNSSYNMKYISLSAYALVWIYSQVDLLFFSGSLFQTEVNLMPERLTYKAKPDEMRLTFSVPLN